MQETFLVNYDVYFGRNNGLLPWHATTIKEDANRPGWPDVNEIKSKAEDLKNDYENNAFVYKLKIEVT